MAEKRGIDTLYTANGDKVKVTEDSEWGGGIFLIYPTIKSDLWNLRGLLTRQITRKRPWDSWTILHAYSGLFSCPTVFCSEMIPGIRHLEAA